MMQCPLCGEEILGAYTSGRWAIRLHMLQKHIDPAYRDIITPCLHCPCGKHFRGLRSFCGHILSLKDQDLREHVTLFALGATGVCEERKWGHPYDR